MKKYVYLLVAVVMLIPNFINRDINEYLPFNSTEKFDPKLDSLNSIDKLEAFLDTKARIQGYSTHSLDYVKALSETIERRFYHGFSHFTLSENWIAAVGERITGIGLSAKVFPNDILTHPNAACSQQSIVVMEILRRKKIDYRKVGFPHHYALEAKIDNNWYYFDPNMEPVMPDSARMHGSWNQQADNLKPYYNARIHTNLNYQFGNGGALATFGSVNDRPAKNARLFQSVSGMLSKILWLLPFVLFLYHFQNKNEQAFRTQTESQP